MGLSDTKAMALRNIWRHWQSTALARFIDVRLRRSLSSPYRSTRRGRLLDRRTVGDLGEILAAQWLSQRGRKILYRNFRALEGGEVDIVCRHGGTLTFVEVKTRTNTDLGRPADAVNQEKQRLILRGARAWLALLGRPLIPTRCDVVEVVLTEGVAPVISVIEGAFMLER